MHHDRGVFDTGWREKEHGPGHAPADREGHGAEGIDRKWVELRPTRSVRLRFYWSVFTGSVLLFFTLLVGTGHYAKAAGPHSVFGMLLFAASILISLLCLVLAVRFWFIRRNLDDARVFLDRQALVRGHSFHARVEQRAQRGLKINDMRVGLICHETVKTNPAAAAGAAPEARAGGGAKPGAKPGTKTIALMEKWETCTRDKSTHGAAQLQATRTFSIPKEKPASTPAGRRELPVVQWKLRVVTVPADGPTYAADFPIFVHASPPQAFWSEISSVDAIPPAER
jgi:hypothetical protein